MTTTAVDHLTRSQRRALNAVLSARTAQADRVHAAVLATKMKVVKALEAGVPAVLLAEHLGVSRARVYQMRDEALVASEPRSD